MKPDNTQQYYHRQKKKNGYTLRISWKFYTLIDLPYFSSNKKKKYLKKIETK